MSVSRRVHTKAVVDHLRAVGSWWAVDDGERTSDPPVAVVYRLDPQNDGTLADPDEDLTLTYQFTCVHTQRDGAERIEDAVLEAIETVTVPGRRVLRVRPSGGGGPVRDESANDKPWMSTPTVTLTTVPEAT